MEKYMNEYLDYLLYQKKYSNKTIIGYRDDLVFFKDFLEINKISVLDVDYSTIRKF